MQERTINRTGIQVLVNQRKDPPGWSAQTFWLFNAVIDALNALYGDVQGMPQEDLSDLVEALQNWQTAIENRTFNNGLPNFSTTDTSVMVTQAKGDLNSPQNLTNNSYQFPIATNTLAGAITAEAFNQIYLNETAIQELENLIGGTTSTRIAWSAAGDFVDINNPTQTELTNVFDAAFPSSSPANSDTVINTQNYNTKWIFDGTSWQLMSQMRVATVSTLGGILSDNGTNSGNIYVESNGVANVVGWAALVSLAGSALQTAQATNVSDTNSYPSVTIGSVGGNFGVIIYTRNNSSDVVNAPSGDNSLVTVNALKQYVQNNSGSSSQGSNTLNYSNGAGGWNNMPNFGVFIDSTTYAASSTFLNIYNQYFGGGVVPNGIRSFEAASGQGIAFASVAEMSGGLFKVFQNMQPYNNIVYTYNAIYGYVAASDGESQVNGFEISAGEIYFDTDNSGQGRVQIGCDSGFDFSVYMSQIGNNLPNIAYQFFAQDGTQNYGATSLAMSIEAQAAAAINRPYGVFARANQQVRYLDDGVTASPYYNAGYVPKPSELITKDYADATYAPIGGGGGGSSGGGNNFWDFRGSKFTQPAGYSSGGTYIRIGDTSQVMNTSGAAQASINFSSRVNITKAMIQLTISGGAIPVNFYFELVDALTGSVIYSTPLITSITDGGNLNYTTGSINIPAGYGFYLRLNYGSNQIGSIVGNVTITGRMSIQ